MRNIGLYSAALSVVVLTGPAGQTSAAQSTSSPDFHTSQQCASCHGNVTTSGGANVSITGDWSASILANSARDPYWLGSVRREVLDHPKASADVQTECSTCHIPLQYLTDKAENRGTDLFTHLPFEASKINAAADGVSCAVCHQIQPAGLGKPATFNGLFAVAPPGTQPRPAFGPFDITNPQVIQVHKMAAGYVPVQSAVIRQAALCATCHVLYTQTLDSEGKPVGRFPEQMTYLEWLNSGYRDKETCQQCHMPAVDGPVAVASVLGQPREGVRHHTFVGANFVMETMLSVHRDELGVVAQQADLTAAKAGIISYLQTKAARVTIGGAELDSGTLSFSVRVENLSGHKLPTAFPSRRAWLHIVVAAADGHVVFESGKLNADGSIAGNANDSNPALFSPHYPVITRPDQVEIYESILGDRAAHVTTGLLYTTQYLKDNRILPDGFDKAHAPGDIAVYGKAASDPAFTAGSSTTRYKIAAGDAKGPFHVSAQLEYQPIGYRWAHNFSPYHAAEPQRFVKYFEQDAEHSALVLAHAEATSSAPH